MIHRTRFKTREEAKAEIFEYIEVWYNRQRLHSSLGFLFLEFTPRSWEKTTPSK
jgi:putative transposase